MDTLEGTRRKSIQSKIYEYSFLKYFILLYYTIFLKSMISYFSWQALQLFFCDGSTCEIPTESDSV
jgi:hypothetical protein